MKTTAGLPTMSRCKIKPILLLAVILLAAALPWRALAAGGSVEIRLFHVNDFHGFAEPYRPFGSFKLEGGIAYLATRLQQLRREKPSLLLAAGDMLHGDNWANLFEGASVIEVMNALGFDAMVAGNHEFDFGQEVLQQRLREANFPVLGANVSGFPGLEPFIIKEVDGVEIGIIGLITPDTAESTHPRNVAGLAFAPPAETLKRYLPELRRRADLVVVLSHLGYLEDRRLARQVPGLDVIVGGHSHTKLTQPVRVGDTIIVQAYDHARMLGVLDLTVTDGKISAYAGRLEAIAPGRLDPDPAVLEIVKKYEVSVDASLNVPVGVAAVDLDGEHVRRRETNLGNLVADVIRERAGAEVAIINGGSIRTSLAQGVITRKSLSQALPYQNSIAVFRLTGAQLKAALEHGVSGVGYQAGRFPQVAGLSFTYRRQAPPGSRVQEVFVGGRPLQPDQEYTVATNDFLAAGGDGYRVFAGAVRLAGEAAPGDGTLVNHAIADYLKRWKTVAPAVEGRIKALD
jgi:5'-nucleotidase / UDP-sugar diphosphatase